MPFKGVDIMDVKKEFVLKSMYKIVKILYDNNMEVYDEEICK